MGTLFTLTMYAPDQDTAERAAKAAFGRMAQLEDILSDYQADSELNELCRKPVGQAVPASADLFAVLKRGQELAEVSAGTFDVTIGPSVRLWRFSRKRKTLPSVQELAAARHAVGFGKLRLDARARTVTLLAEGMRLDVGGIAKGYAADEALRLLKSMGIDRALVAASGDIVAGNPPPGQGGWKVAISGHLELKAGLPARGGLNDSSNAGSPMLSLKNAAVSTSGDAEQFVEIDGVRYSHIVNPATGLGLTNRIQATVIAENGTSSDALATAVCILGPENGLKLIRKLKRTAVFIVTGEASPPLAGSPAFSSKRSTRTFTSPSFARYVVPNDSQRK